MPRSARARSPLVLVSARAAEAIGRRQAGIERLPGHQRADDRIDIERPQAQNGGLRIRLAAA